MDRIIVGENYKYNIDYHRFADYLGLDVYDRDDAKMAEKLDLLYEWGADKSGSKDFQDITMEITKLQRKVGVSYIGKTLVKTLNHWARIDMDNKRLKVKQKIENEKVKKSRERLESYHRRASDLKKERQKDKDHINKSNELTDRRNNYYVKKQEGSYKREKPIKVRDIPIAESTSELV